uniref:Uncharacterized protein n=1 Tax=Glossina brevipalpis TaxID=37001 RepID=A0A1A9X3U8_9MUSC
MKIQKQNPRTRRNKYKKKNKKKKKSKHKKDYNNIKATTIAYKRYTQHLALAVTILCIDGDDDDDNFLTQFRTQRFKAHIVLTKHSTTTVYLFITHIC